MVKTKVSKDAKFSRRITKEAIKNILGRTLTITRVTETLDDFGQLSARSTASETFIGDIQFGLDLDHRFITTGMVEVGDAILYIEPNALSTLPVPEDIIEDTSTNSKWEINSAVESPELGGFVTHYSYRCKRLIESDDTGK